MKTKDLIKELQDRPDHNLWFRLMTPEADRELVYIKTLHWDNNILDDKGNPQAIVIIDLMKKYRDE